MDKIERTRKARIYTLIILVIIIVGVILFNIIDLDSMVKSPEAKISASISEKRKKIVEKTRRTKPTSTDSTEELEAALKENNENNESPTQEAVSQQVETGETENRSQNTQIEQPSYQPNQSSQVEQPQTPIIVSGEINEVMTLINQKRAERGIAGLTYDSGALQQAVNARAGEISVNFAHSRNGGPWYTVFDEFNVSYSTGAENIYHRDGGSYADAVNGWFSSAGHMKNMMNGEYTRVSIGHYNGYYAMLLI